MAKYSPFQPIPIQNRSWPNNQIIKSPIWCSVDLRDGNQALQTPMSVKTKIEFFKLLVNIGFKEIEVGFPAASQIEFDYLRELVNNNLIPNDVTVQILCQAREHLIQKSIEALKGTKQAIFHLYNSTSPLQRKVTFSMSKEQIIHIALQGVAWLKEAMKQIPDTKIILEYSPESFSNTEIDYAIKICNAVYEAWNPTPDEKVIFNLPATVESATPNIYADQIEYFIKNIKHRENCIISLHTHNDRGTGVAATELGLMAGADRVEGTLFGNGERTGNLDIITVALNMFSQGIDPKLDFSDIISIREAYEEFTGMMVHPRHPYGGDLVYTAFSGSHQDAIQKGMNLQKTKGEDEPWEVPYLPIDPKDIGRSYKAIIRFNSQSGKGGAAYLLKSEYGLQIPKGMYSTVGNILNQIADSTGKELDSKEIYNAFCDHFISEKGPLKLVDFQFVHPSSNQENGVATVEVEYDSQQIIIRGVGKGPLDGFVDALRKQQWKEFDICEFSEHSLGEGSDISAAAYICLKSTMAGEQKTAWGCGIDADISKSGVKALINAFNQL